MTSLTKVYNIGALALAALLLVGTVVAIGLFSTQPRSPIGASMALADEGDDKGERPDQPLQRQWPQGVRGREEAHARR